MLLPSRPFWHQRGGLRRGTHSLIRKLQPRSLRPHEKWSIRTAEAFKPDLVLCLTQSLSAEVHERLKRLGVRYRVAWWGDTPANLQRMDLLEGDWTHIFIKDGLAAQKLRVLGLPCSQMHEAMNPGWHRPQGTQRTDHVAVVGNYYGYRLALVERLQNRGVSLDLYGPLPPRWASETIHASHRRSFVTHKKKAAVFEGALACLNSTHMSEGDSLNCRAFEICGSGGLQLIEDKPSVRECFEPGAEVLTYNSEEAILESLARARADRQWADSVRSAGRRRAHQDHTYRARVEHILEKCKASG